MKKNIGSFLLVILLIICSYFFLDKEIAVFVRKTLMAEARLDIFSANIPDLLFPIVCAITGIAWTAYFYFAHKGIIDTRSRFFQLVAFTVPFAFFLKSILKYVIGRINTRFWLLHPGFQDFHVFHGNKSYSGFPSGHMAVFTALIIALWRFYPRYRPAYAGFLSVLALALIVTDYHFLSDVIAGAYLGLIVHFCTLRGLSLMQNPKQGNMTL